MVAVVIGPLLGDFVDVAALFGQALAVVVVDQDQVALALLLVIEELAAVAQQLQEIAVAIDAGRQMAQLAEQSALGFAIARVEVAQLGIEQVVEEQRAVAGAFFRWGRWIKAAALFGLFPGHHRPADRRGIGQDARLNGFVLARSGHLGGAPFFFAIPPRILTEPGGNQRRVVIEDEFVSFEPESLTKKRQIVLKQSKATRHGRTSRHEDFRCWAISLQPVPYHFDDRLWQVIMRLNILSGNIGTKPLIAIAITIKDEAGFQLVCPRAKPPGAKEEAKLQGHVEAWQACVGPNFSTGNIMNTIPAVFDDLGNLINADYSRVFRFKG